MEQCKNCGQAIGNLEPAHVFQGQVVCATCFERLSPQPLPYAVPAHPSPVPRKPIQQVEMTAKNWKFYQLIGAIILVPSVIVLFGGFVLAIDTRRASPVPPIVPLAVGGVGTAVGLFFYVRGRLGAWWNHG
jgi:hypothetical protein